MWPNSSSCDFCPYNTEYSTSSGTVCENCECLKAERRRNRMMVALESDSDQEEPGND